MIRTTMVLGALLLATPGFAQSQQEAPAAPAVDSSAPAQDANSFDLARTKLAQCPGERFDFEVADQPGAKGTSVALCSDAGASKDQISAMLESAVRQLESTDRMSPENRDQIVAQIRAKLAEVQAR